MSKLSKLNVLKNLYDEISNENNEDCDKKQCGKDTINNDVKNMFNILKKVYDHIPFLILICGGINQGKSVCLLSIIKYNDIAKKFHEILIFSSTIHTGIYTKNGIKNVNQFDEIDSQKLLKIKEYQIKQGNKRKNILLVIDDALATLNKKDIPEFIKLLSTLRHFNISIVFVSQSIKGIPVLLRTNSYFHFIYRMIGRKNMDILFEELSQGENKKEFIDKFLKKCENHNAIFIDNYYKSLDDRISCFKVHPDKLKIKMK